MKRMMGLFCALAAAAVLSALPSAALALPDNGGYTIKAYDVSAKVYEDNTYDVTETVTVDFLLPRHGIYRSIPLSGPLYRPSGGDGVYTMAVDNVTVEGAPYEVTWEDGSVFVKIGDGEAYAEGEHTYRISYRVTMSDGEPGFDEAYLILTGNSWDTAIDHVTFTVAFPKPFDFTKSSFMLGGSGYAQEDLRASVDGNVISGSVQRPLKSNEGLTLRVELPQGYFAPAAGGVLPKPDLPVDPPNDAEQPGGGATAGIPQAGGIIGPVFAFASMLGVIALVIVLAARRPGGAGGFAARSTDDSQDELQRMNQMHQMHQMDQMNQMNQAQQMNQMTHVDTTPTDTGGNTGGGGSW